MSYLDCHVPSIKYRGRRVPVNYRILLRKTNIVPSHPESSKKNFPRIKRRSPSP